MKQIYSFRGRARANHPSGSCFPRCFISDGWGLNRLEQPLARGASDEIGRSLNDQHVVKSTLTTAFCFRVVMCSIQWTLKTWGHNAARQPVPPPVMSFSLFVRAHPMRSSDQRLVLTSTPYSAERSGPGQDGNNGTNRRSSDQFLIVMLPCKSRYLCEEPDDAQEGNFTI
jgi:hypothetical protein